MSGTLRLGGAVSVQRGDLAIASTADLIIRWDCATLDPPARTVVFDHGAGHAGLLLDPRVAQAAGVHLTRA